GAGSGGADRACAACPSRSGQRRIGRAGARRQLARTYASPCVAGIPRRRARWAGGHFRPVVALVAGGRSDDLADRIARFAAVGGGAPALATDPSTSGFALAAGAGMPFQGSLHGVSAGVTSLRFVARATAERGDAPPPLELSRDVIVRAGPLPVLASLSLPGQVE